MTRDKIARKCICCFKKYHWIILFFILAAGVFLYSRIPAVLADSPVNKNGLSTDFKNFLKGFSRTNFTYMKEAYSGFQAFVTGKTSSSYTSIIDTVRGLSTGIGTVFVVIYGLYTLFTEITKCGETDMSLGIRV